MYSYVGNEWELQLIYAPYLLHLLLFSHSVMSDTLWSHGLQHTRLPCHSLSPGVCSNSCLLSWWYYLTISPSASPFSFCLQFFPASVSFPMSQVFPSGGQIIGASTSASVIPINIWCWFPLGLTDLISLLFQGALKNLLQYHNLKESILRH